MAQNLGILCPVSVLPNRHGIGDFGNQTKVFIDILQENGANIWQILPLHPSLQANSPYRAISCYAGDSIYISLDSLYEEGLLPYRVPDYKANSTRVDYQSIRILKEWYLKIAFYNFTKNDAYEAFVTQNAWVKDYAMYMAFSKICRTASWYKWPQQMQEYESAKQMDLHNYQKEIDYQIFMQYIFFMQWHSLKEYANARDIEIFGDIPFYVDIDSMEVWQDKQNFLLKEDNEPSFVAGVPPDYFSATGQMWGNPIYDWEYLQIHNFDFWVHRLQYATTVFDILRIDHFRAFDTYWKIPGDAKTAMEGHWQEAPGYAALQRIIDAIPSLKLVAEDLGEIREEVRILKDSFSIPGMKIFQFQLQDGFDHLQSNLLYTGTHDNETLVGWYQGAEQSLKNWVLYYLGTNDDSDIHLKIMKYCYEKAETVVFPIWDVMGLDNSARFNVPGQIYDTNWTFRLTEYENMNKSLKSMKCFINPLYTI